MKTYLRRLAIFLACAVTLLPVMYVNNALDIAEMIQKEIPGQPVIEISVEDPCDAIMDVIVTVVIMPGHSGLDITSSTFDKASPCKSRPYALVTTENMHLKTADGRILERGFLGKTGPTEATSGTLERSVGSSSFAIPLRGDSDARFQIPKGALDAGFGESSIQVQILARNLICPDWNEPIKEEGSSAKPRNCAIPTQAILQYANAVYELSSSLPPPYGLTTGPNLGEAGKDKSYSTTRLHWTSRATAPSSAIKGTLTGFEIHLMDRQSTALRQFVTVAGSAVFGTFVSMLLAFRASRGERSSGDSAGQRRDDVQRRLDSDSSSPPSHPATFSVLGTEEP